MTVNETLCLKCERHGQREGKCTGVEFREGRTGAGGQVIGVRDYRSVQGDTEAAGEREKHKADHKLIK